MSPYCEACQACPINGYCLLAGCPMPKPECDHHFQGWRESDDGLLGEQFCAHCDIGMFEWSMRFLP